MSKVDWVVVGVETVEAEAEAIGTGSEAVGVVGDVAFVAAAVGAVPAVAVAAATASTVGSSKGGNSNSSPHPLSEDVVDSIFVSDWGSLGTSGSARAGLDGWEAKKS